MSKDFEAIALSQSVELGRQAELIRELIRERDAEKSNAEAAYDMAEQYARRLGVNIARDDVLKYVEQYWQSRGSLERYADGLETFRWDVFQIRHELRRATEAQLAASDSAHLANQIIQRIEHINRSGSPRKKAPLFPRPLATGLENEKAPVTETGA